MRTLAFLVVMLLIQGSVFAFEPVPIKNYKILDSFQQPFQLESGDMVRLHGLYGLNRLGERELLIYLVESHILTFRSEQLVMVGRDLDDDGHIDTCFIKMMWV